ncbi:MAG: GTP-binding protein [Deltaproteobacteria bacterium]|nr:GTP-binding protein [Deltaproteobacteria bacterium]MBW2500439.1 GTP-binding protein [Deltaproteobacteria bacterium]
MSDPTDSQTDATRRVPALVLSGFLGSGKTTLVQRLLADARERGIRIALVSNELGELGIDRALLGQGGQSYVELEGGCVCCELSDDLLETLVTLHREVDPDRFVIETSGVALPYDTQLNFWREPACDFIGDDMAVVVVNADQLHEGRDLEGTFEDQVQSADLLVLNKLDLVPEAEWPEIEARLREIEPEAPLVHAVRGDVDLDLLFPPDAGELDRRGPAPEAPPHHHEHFATSEWRPERGIRCADLEAALAQEGLLRAKGFVETDEGTRLVQVVGRRIEISVPDEPPPDELLGRVVLIRRAPR